MRSRSRSGSAAARPRSPSPRLRPSAAIVGVAQHEVAEVRALAGGIDAGFDGLEAQDGAAGILVAQRHEDGRLDAQRRGVVAGGCVGRNFGKRIALEVQEPQADQGVPEAQHRPGRAQSKADEQDQIDPRPAAGAQDHAGHPQHRHVGDHIQGEHDAPPPRQLTDGLEAGWCRKAQARWRQGQRRGLESFGHGTIIEGPARARVT